MLGQTTWLIQGRIITDTNLFQTRLFHPITRTVSQRTGTKKYPDRVWKREKDSVC